MLRIELVLEAHYHGDTALCAFGPGRRFLLAWRPALAPGGWERLEAAFPGALIELSDEDAARYAANSFALTQDGASHLVMPGGVSERLLAQVRERGVTPVVVDVSRVPEEGRRQREVHDRRPRAGGVLHILGISWIAAEFCVCNRRRQD